MYLPLPTANGSSVKFADIIPPSTHPGSDKNPTPGGFGGDMRNAVESQPKFRLIPIQESAPL